MLGYCAGVVEAAEGDERRRRLNFAASPTCIIWCGARFSSRGRFPNALLTTFEAATAPLPRATEAERLVVQRVGQNIFRNGLLEYWQGRCAITGLAIPELLRASHMKAWAACERDAERLDVFNGLLLAPNLDALFDVGLITVSDAGAVLVSEALSAEERRLLGLDARLFVKGLTSHHGSYLTFHRAKLFRDASLKNRPSE